jgi:hypothetical protein
MTLHLFLTINIIDGEHIYSHRSVCHIDHDDWSKEDYAEAVASQILGWNYSDLELPKQNDCGQWESPCSSEYRLTEIELDCGLTEILFNEFELFRRFLGIQSVMFPFTIRVDGEIFTLKEDAQQGRMVYKSQETEESKEVYDPLEAYCHMTGINIKEGFPEMTVESWIDADFC